MIKFYCDKCSKETTEDKINRIIENDYAYDLLGNKLIGFPKLARDLCEECYEKYKQLNIDTDDFMAMSDEEIELALYTFKVGDQVITDDGRVGTITDICTCDRCKERGFYEPSALMEDGERIWITDTAKENGFKSYYQIGDRVFGNLEEGCIERIEQRILRRKSELVALENQLNMAKKLKEEKENEL